MTGEIAAMVTYALLSLMLGYYSFSRISILIDLKRQINRKPVSDYEE
ncbi:MAG: hypothetical protein ABGX21_06350 [Candidatus Poseidoniia archaeon]